MNNPVKLESGLLVVFVLVSFLSCLAPLNGIDFNKLYRERLEKEGNNPVLYNAAARHYFVQGELDMAETLLKKNLSNYPDDMDSTFLLAAIFTRKENYQQARKMFYPLLKVNPVNPNHVHLYSLILDRMGEPRSAARYRKAFNLPDPDQDSKKADPLLVIMKAAITSNRIKKDKKTKQTKAGGSPDTKEPEQVPEPAEVSVPPETPQQAVATGNTMSIPDQEELARNYLNLIFELENEVEKYRDNQAIIKNANEIIKNAPDTEAAMNMIWKLHKLYLGANNVPRDLVKVDELLGVFVGKYEAVDPEKTRQAYRILTECSEESEDWEYMRYYAEEFLKRDAQDAEMRVKKAKALSKSGELEAGVEMLKQIRNEDPESIAAFKAWQVMKDLGINEEESHEANGTPSQTESVQTESGQTETQQPEPLQDSNDPGNGSEPKHTPSDASGTDPGLSAEDFE